MKASKNAHDWHCEAHDTYGWRGEECRQCPVAPSEITTLREQVEKLTKERDAEIARNKPLRALISSLEETKSILLKKSAENKEAVTQLDSERQANAALTEELAALAEQFQKTRTVLCKLGDHDPDCSVFDLDDEGRHKDCTCGLTEALSLPDLASPVLNRIRAEGMRMAADYCTKNTLASAHSLAVRLRDQAAELEKTNG